MAKYNPPVTTPAVQRGWQVGDQVQCTLSGTSGVVIELRGGGFAKVLRTDALCRGRQEDASPRATSAWKLVNEEQVPEPTVTPATITVDLPLPLAYLIATLEGAAPGITVDARHPQLKGCWDALRTIGHAIEYVLPEGRTATLAAEWLSLDPWHNTVKEINKL